MKNLVLNIIKYAIDKLFWYLIICPIFNLIPNLFIRKIIKKEFYKHIYQPAFNYIFNKAYYVVNCTYHKIQEELKYISERLW